MLIKCLLQDAWLGLPGIGCANFARGKKCPSRNYGPHHGGLNHSLGHLTLVSLLRKHLEAESWNPRKESVFYRKDHLMPEYQLGLFLLKWPSNLCYENSESQFLEIFRRPDFKQALKSHENAQARTVRLQRVLSGLDCCATLAWDSSPLFRNIGPLPSIADLRCLQIEFLNRTKARIVLMITL